LEVTHTLLTQKLQSTKTAQTQSTMTAYKLGLQILMINFVVNY